MAKEIPILFSTPMVKAILDGRKTQTRRLDGLGEINKEPNEWKFEGLNGFDDYLFFNSAKRVVGYEPPECMEIAKCRYKKGRNIWVRETFEYTGLWIEPTNKSYEQKEADGNSKTAYWEQAIKYKADNKIIAIVGQCEKQNDVLNIYQKFTPSIFMPKWACRLKLKITDVRVERLQDISEENAKAEGVSKNLFAEHLDNSLNNGEKPQAYINNFRSLWDSLNKKRGFGWDKNPFVWVIEFENIKDF